VDWWIQWFGNAQQRLFEGVVQPLLFGLGQASLLEDAYGATGWLLVGLLQIFIMVAVIAPLQYWRAAGAPSRPGAPPRGKPAGAVGDVGEAPAGAAKKRSSSSAHLAGLRRTLTGLSPSVRAKQSALASAGPRRARRRVTKASGSIMCCGGINDECPSR